MVNLRPPQKSRAEREKRRTVYTTVGVHATPTGWCVTEYAIELGCSTYAIRKRYVREEDEAQRIKIRWDDQIPTRGGVFQR